VESLKVLVLFLAGEVISEKDKCGNLEVFVSHWSTEIGSLE
jgi:hypothetical protein